MYTRDTLAFEPPSERQSLEQQVRYLEERLAFYEGFDLLIQDNVANARELFRLAAQEREAAGSAANRTRHETRAGHREARLRGELAAIAQDLEALTQTVAALSHRIAQALEEPNTFEQNGWQTPPETLAARRVAVVAHGIPTARTALSLHRFVASLPQVADVSAREYTGGILRLDARVQERLHADQFRTWEDAPHIHVLTEDAEVIEFAVEGQETIDELVRV